VGGGDRPPPPRCLALRPGVVRDDFPGEGPVAVVRDRHVPRGRRVARCAVEVAAPAEAAEIGADVVGARRQSGAGDARLDVLDERVRAFVRDAVAGADVPVVRVDEGEVLHRCSGALRGRGGREREHASESQNE